MPRAPAIPTRSGALMPPPPASSCAGVGSPRPSLTARIVSSSVGRVGQDETVDDVGAEAGELEAAPGVLDLVGRPAPAAGLLVFQEEMALLPVRTEVREQGHLLLE